jgi:hypothetical protein
MKSVRKDECVEHSQKCVLEISVYLFVRTLLVELLSEIVLLYFIERTRVCLLYSRCLCVNLSAHIHVCPSYTHILKILKVCEL